MNKVVKILICLLVNFLFLEISFAKDVSSDSVYNLNDIWINQKGEKIEFNKLKGSTSLVAMIFSSCPSACPMIVADIKSIHNKIPEQIREKIQIRLFSFDHEVDTPEKLFQFHSKHKLDSNWSLYSGNKEGITNLAAVLEVQYKRLDRGSYAHSNQIFLIDENGAIKAMIKELGEDPEPILKAAPALFKK